jgi:hypothetical protein
MEMEFLDSSSAILAMASTEALVVFVSVPNVLTVFVVEAPVVDVDADPDEAVVVVIHRPVRPWIAGFPGLGSVNESLDRMRCTLCMSGRSDTAAWQHSRPSWMHSRVCSVSGSDRDGSTISSARPPSNSFHV